MATAELKNIYAMLTCKDCQHHRRIHGQWSSCVEHPGLSDDILWEQTYCKDLKRKVPIGDMEK